MSTVELSVAAFSGNRSLPHVEHHREALTNELVRLIWACYKEGYFRAEDDVYFMAQRGPGNQSRIGGLDEAQELLYDMRPKADLDIDAHVQGKIIPLRSTRDFLDMLRPFLARAFPQTAISDERWEHWIRVSEDAVHNEALAIADKVVLDETIAPYGSVLNYAAGLSPNDTFAFFCRYAAYFGRFDMPFSKMKLPADNKEALRYAPEFGNEVAVALIAVRDRHVVVNSCGQTSINALIAQEYPQAYDTWYRSLKATGKAPEQYVALPVHPLALPLYAQMLQELIDSGEVILHTSASIPTRAGLSYRTMIPLGEESYLAIKLAVPLQLTGYVRYIDTEELRAAPQLSERLAMIFTRESNFGGRLRLDKELVTACVVPQRDSTQAPVDTPYLSCLIRENQGRSLPPGSITMPLAALFSASSISGKPVLIEAMEKAGTGNPEQAMAYFARYIDITLNSVLRLYLRHGIMLEAHQQNLGITFDAGGRIDRLHYHDIACAVFFFRPAYLAAGHPGQTLQGLSHPYASDDMKHSCAQFVHTVLLLNMLPVIDVIAGYYEVPKTRLLKQVFDAIIAILAEERAAHTGEDRSASAVFSKFYNDFEQQVLASPTFSAKRLLGRLFKQSQTRCWGEVPNRDPEFSEVRGSAIPIENPFHVFHAGTATGGDSTQTGAQPRLGRSIVEHLGDRIATLCDEMQTALHRSDVLSEPSITRELRAADQAEALRLVASAFRENLIGENEGYHFVVRTAGREIHVRNAATAAAIRSPSIPADEACLFLVHYAKETELIGVEGALMALRPALERCQPMDEKAWERLLHASHQSVRNEAMAVAYKRAWGEEMLKRFDDSGDVFGYLDSGHSSAYRFFNRLAAFDARTVTPFSKMKLDLSVRDVLRHSPEFCQTVAIRFAALHRDCAKTAVTQRYRDFLSGFDALFPGVLPRWSQALSSSGMEPSDYLPMPIHPLNLAWVRDNLGDLLGSKALILLEHVEENSMPTLSFRSMLMQQQCLKLPVPLQTTHLIRGVATHEIELGPLFSDIFETIIDREGLGDRLVLERDLLGAYIDPQQVRGSADVAAMLGFVSRQNPDVQVRPGEHVVPVAGLFSVVPGKRRPFFFNIMQRLGVLAEDDQYQYFSDYVRLVVGTQLELFFKTGLMLEAHQQNLNIVYDAQWGLQRLMYHDIPGGVSAFVPLLKARHAIPDTIATGLYYFRETPDRSVFQFVHPTLTAHLGPLAQAASRHLKLDRARLHLIIRDEIVHCIQWGRALVPGSALEGQLRSELIDKFETVVLGSRTLPGKMMFGRIYLQSLNEDWGRKVPNPELLSERVLIPARDLHNFLTVDTVNASPDMPVAASPSVAG